jgi:hypothetical protein
MSYFAAGYRLYIWAFFESKRFQEGRIHPNIISLYQKHYTINLADVVMRLGPDPSKKGNALTDCSTIYWPQEDWLATQIYYDTVINGERLDMLDERFGSTWTPYEDVALRWLFHELAHVEQCSYVGGRDRYGALWVSNALSTFGLEWDVDFKSILTWDAQVFHDRMPMEREADKYADLVLDYVRGRSGSRWNSDLAARYVFLLVGSDVFYAEVDNQIPEVYTFYTGEPIPVG